jgi:hypothetical protein
MVKLIIAFILGVAVGYFGYPQINDIYAKKDKITSQIKDKAVELKKSAEKVINQ